MQIPFLQRVAAAHALHHVDKFGGVPYGLFLGPQELAAVGGLPDLERQLAKQTALEAKRAATGASIAHSAAAA